MTTRSLAPPNGGIDAGRSPVDARIDQTPSGATADVAVADVAPVDSARADLNAPADVALPSDRGPMPDGAGADAGAVSDVMSASEGGRLRCNGHEALCDRRFNEVVFPATHNSMSNADDPWFGPNQEHGIGRQLQDGIRALLIDTHPWKGGLYLCHSVCDLGNRLLADALGDIATFLRNNPNEVLTLLIEDHISPGDTERAFEAAGLLGSVYVHTPGGNWPTLRAMIATGRRLLVTAENQRSTLPWYHHLWDLASDTPYTFKNTQEFSCRANRGARSNDLFLVNHWVENPLPSLLFSRPANARDLLLMRAQACQAERGKLPNFVAVNHYATGDLFAVVRLLNGLSP